MMMWWAIISVPPTSLCSKITTRSLAKYPTEKAIVRRIQLVSAASLGPSTMNSGDMTDTACVAQYSTQEPIAIAQCTCET